MIILLMVLSKVMLGQHSEVFDQTVHCLNDKLRGANLGLENLIKEHGAFRDLDSSVEHYSYSTISTYNKLDIKFSIHYYYHTSIETARAFEDRLIQLHNLELSKISTEKILRLGKLIVVIDHFKKFNGIYDYNRTVSLLIYDTYINRCQSN